jgi:hypothetical protein
MTQEGVEVHPKKTHEGLVILENFPKGGGKKDRGGEFLEELFKGGAQQGTLIRSIPPLPSVTGAEGRVEEDFGPKRLLSHSKRVRRKARVRAKIVGKAISKGIFGSPLFYAIGRHSSRAFLKSLRAAPMPHIADPVCQTQPAPPRIKKGLHLGQQLLRITDFPPSFLKGK